MKDPKLELVHSWLSKAKNDLGSAKQLSSGVEPYLDTAIYHCQQAAEKSLKAFLTLHDTPFEKSHNLTILAELCAEKDSGFKDFSDLLADLTPYATAFRYPSEFFEEEPDKEEVKKAVQQAEKIYQFILKKIPKQKD